MDQIENDVIFSISLGNMSQVAKEIYYADGRRSLFTYKVTRNLIIGFVAMILVMAFLYLLAYSENISLIFLLALSAIALICIGIALFYQVRAYLNWKGNADSFLEVVRKNEPYTLVVRERIFEFVGKVETDVEKWKEIKRAKFYENRIEVICDGTWYLWPAKSMTAEEYDRLKVFIKARLNQEEEPGA